MRALLFAAWCCATAPVAAQEAPSDPLMGWNRAIYSFNDGLDRYALKPLAQGYDAVMPLPAKLAFRNFVDNFGDLPNALNNLLQGKVASSANDLGRVLINTTLGIGGAMDIASEMGLAKHQEDFGQTLAVWGVGGGPYLVLPLLGPSTLRDTAALPVDYLISGRHLVIESVPVRNSITGLSVVDKRAALLGVDEALDQAALDPYLFVRNFYLKRRTNQIYDGDPPRVAEERFDDEVTAPPPGENE